MRAEKTREIPDGLRNALDTIAQQVLDPKYRKPPRVRGECKIINHYYVGPRLINDGSIRPEILSIDYEKHRSAKLPDGSQYIHHAYLNIRLKTNPDVVYLIDMDHMQNVGYLRRIGRLFTRRPLQPYMVIPYTSRKELRQGLKAHSIDFYARVSYLYHNTQLGRKTVVPPKR